MSEPTTEAGRALDDRLAYDTGPERYLPGDYLREYREAILAIEAEAKAQGALHEHLAAEGETERAIAAERARLRAAVEALPVHYRRNGFASGTAWLTRRHVLAILAEPQP